MYLVGVLGIIGLLITGIILIIILLKLINNKFTTPEERESYKTESHNKSVDSGYSTYAPEDGMVWDKTEPAYLAWRAKQKLQ